MRNFLFLTLGSSLLFLAGCDEGQGTQIGNEGVITEPDPETCANQVLSSETTPPRWPISLGVATDLLLGELEEITFDDGGVAFAGELAIDVMGYRYDNDCSHILVDVEATYDFGGRLTTTALGDLEVPVDDPTVAAGILMADDWTGSLVDPPSQGAALLFDTTVTAAGYASKLVYETCDLENMCEESDVGSILSVQ